MELLNKFPKGFFNSQLPEATPSKNPDDKIIPIEWSKEVKNKKKKGLVKKLSKKVK